MLSWKSHSRTRPVAFALLLAFELLLTPSLIDSATRAPAGALAPPVASPAPSEGQYKISARESRFMVRAFAGGLFSALAHDHNIAIREFSGEARFTFGTVEPASLQLTIKADSLAVTDKVSDGDRKKIEDTMRSEVLEVDKYPEIVFRSTSFSASRIDEAKYQTKITGDLTLHGATHPLTIGATVTFFEASLRAQGQFAVRQSDFGIKPVSVAGGTVKVKNELRFSFDIVANR